MVNKHMKKHSMSLTIKEMQIKTVLRFHLNPVRMAVIKKTPTKNGEDILWQGDMLLVEM
jgi:hypothetical protein